MKSNTFSLRTNRVIILFCLAIVSFLGLYGCNNKATNIEEPKQSNVKVVLTADTTISKVALIKYGRHGFSPDDFVPYQDTVEFTFDEPLTELYQLMVMKDDRMILDQLWFNEEELTIVAHFNKNDKYITIDTVLNSPFHYYTKGISNQYFELKKNGEELNVTNSFLLDKIKDNINNPFSASLSSNYLYDNSENPDNLKILQNLIQDQDSTIKNHFFSKHEQLKKLLNTSVITLNDFNFYNQKEEVINIPLNKDSLYLLDFWFTKCAPCLKDHIIMEKEINKLSKSNIKVIGISNDHHQSDWMSLLDKKNYSWDNYRENPDHSITKHIGVSLYPTYLLINGKGEILQKNSTFEDCMVGLKTKGLIE